MSHRHVALVLAAVLAIAGWGVGCTSEGEATALEAYFERLERLDSDFGERGGALAEEMQSGIAAASTDAEAIDAAREGLRSFGVLLDDFATNLEALAAPPEAVEAHDRTFEATTIVSNELAILVERLEEPATPAEAAALTNAAFTSAGFVRLNEACAALQSVAEDNDIDAELGCG